jgi:hypothetical protein
MRNVFRKLEIQAREQLTGALETAVRGDSKS